MSVTRDPSCALIERPSDRRDTLHVDEKTPHTEAVDAQMSVTRIAVDVLLGMRCLIQHATVTPDEVRIRLLRRPMPGVLERHATHQWWSTTADGALTGMVWRGVLIEWPILPSEIPPSEDFRADDPTLAEVLA